MLLLIFGFKILAFQKVLRKSQKENLGVFAVADPHKLKGFKILWSLRSGKYANKMKEKRFFEDIQEHSMF